MLGLYEPLHAARLHPRCATIGALCPSGIGCRGDHCSSDSVTIASLLSSPSVFYDFLILARYDETVSNVSEGRERMLCLYARRPQCQVTVVCGPPQLLPRRLEENQNR
jgi:hypothetical protein